MPYALRVAWMLREMYSLSFSARLGLTENCSRIIGQATPTTRLDPTISAAAKAGRRRSRSTIVEKNIAATNREITSRMICAGSIALISV